MTQSYEATEATRVLTREEITHLTEEGGKPADTLMNVVALIATRFNTDVCSAYLLEPDRSNLVLAATLGLHPRSIGTLRMPLNEGLTGLVFACGAWRLWRRRKASAADFGAGKATVALGAGIAFLVWFVGFIVVGGEWFAMWQSPTWNGQESAFRFVTCFLLVIVFVMQKEE